MSVYMKYLATVLKPLEDADLKLLPMGSMWTFNAAQDQYLRDVSYAAMGDPLPVTGVSVEFVPALDADGYETTGYVAVRFDTVSFNVGSNNGAMRGVALYIDTGDANTSSLIAADNFLDAGGDVVFPDDQGLITYFPNDGGFLQLLDPIAVQ